MIRKVVRALYCLCVTFPLPVFSQALVVFGGDEKARACYDNAEYAAQNMPIIHRALLEPCNYALEFGSLSLADRAATYANRGIILAANEDIDAAMADYRKAVAIRPQAPEIYVNRGNAYFLDRDYGMALQDYEKAIDLDIGQLHYVRYNMGMAFEKLGNDAAAEREYRHALEIEPGWELAENKLARLLERRAEAAIP